MQAHQVLCSSAIRNSFDQFASLRCLIPIINVIFDMFIFLWTENVLNEVLYNNILSLNYFK